MINQQPTDSAAHYDHVTPAWTIICGDDFHHGLFDDDATDLVTGTTELTRTMAVAAQPGPGTRIVDLGCGTGTQALWLTEHHPDVSVVAVTSSRVGAEFARRRIEDAGRADAVSIVCGDALDSGLADHAFDVAWLLESSQYLGPLPRLMKECRRLLGPGGRLALCDATLGRRLELRDLRHLHRELDTLRGAFGDAVMVTPGDYLTAAQEGGFQDIRMLDLTQRIAPTFARWRRRAERDRTRILALLPEHELDNFIAGCDVMERFFAEGIVGYSLLSARAAA